MNTKKKTIDPKWEAVKKRMGTVPDRIIAEEMDVSTQWVAKVRTGLGISPFQPYRTGGVPNANQLITLPNGTVKVMT